MINRTEARIDLNAIHNNIKNIMVDSNAKVLAVVKADAYGHGASAVALYLQDKGISNFAVACTDEGVELRKSGIKGMILVLGKTSKASMDKLVEFNLSQACDSYEYAVELAKHGNVNIHIKIDTGMSRLGFYCHCKEDIDGCIEKISPVFSINGVKIEGIFTHFADTDTDSFTERQFSVFKELTNRLLDNGYNIGIRHCCNSAAAIKYPHMHLDMVRLGIALYGLERSVPSFPMDISMSVYAGLTSINILKAGDTVSYGRTHTLDRTTKVGVVSFGYADGMPRLLSDKFYVSINGQKASILGRVCMDMFMVDITDIECAEGDEVCIFGKNGEVNEMADIIGTINYELVCGINKRVPRIY